MSLPAYFRRALLVFLSAEVSISCSSEQQRATQGVSTTVAQNLVAQSLRSLPPEVEYSEAQQKDLEWCAEVQRFKAGFPGDRLKTEITQKIYDRTFEFALSKPSAKFLSENVLGISVASMLNYERKTMDTSMMPNVAQSISCKNKSTESLAKLSGMSLPVTPSCSAHNKAAYEWALETVSAQTRENFLKHGRQLRFAEDRRLASGVQWVPALLLLEKDSTEHTATVTSPALLTGVNAPAGLDGMHYCKLLAPTRAMEWILVEGLKD